jgi:hypothetical protein
VRLAGLEAQARKRARTHRNLRSALAPSYLSRSTRRNKASMTMIGPKMAFILRVGSFREFAPAHEAGVYHLPVVFDVLGVPSLAHLIHHSRRGPQNPPTRQHKQLATRREAISLPSAEGRQGRTLGRGHKGREERRLVRASRR